MRLPYWNRKFNKSTKFICESTPYDTPKHWAGLWRRGLLGSTTSNPTDDKDLNTKEKNSADGLTGAPDADETDQTPSFIEVKSLAYFKRNLILATSFA